MLDRQDAINELMNCVLRQLDVLLRQKRRPDLDCRLFELLGLWLVNETDDAHFARALRADKRVCFIDLADKVRPVLFNSLETSGGGTSTNSGFPMTSSLYSSFPSFSEFPPPNRQFAPSADGW